jgi:DNA-binding transcriptional LysR family regulator
VDTITAVSTDTSSDARSPSTADGDGLSECARSLQAMAVFAAVVEARSFTIASTALGISPSAASRCIARLEARLGVKLLERSPRVLEPTPAGRVFYDRSRRILRDAADAHAALARAALGPQAASLGDVEGGGAPSNDD